MTRAHGGRLTILQSCHDLHRSLFDDLLLRLQLPPRLQVCVEKHVRVDELQRASFRRERKDLLRELGSVKSTLSGTTIESNRMVASTGSTGASSIPLPFRTSITLSYFY